MASTVALEQLGIMMEQQICEIDSESSNSCEEREARKRLREDTDNNSSGSPKKRRKQTTPVRFPASLMSNSGERHESEVEEEEDNDEEQEHEEEDEDDDADVNDLNGENPVETNNAGSTVLDNEEIDLLEGKTRTISPRTFVRNNVGQTTTATETMETFEKDENLNSEFRCQFCGLTFNNMDTLTRHVDCEHAIVCNSLQAAPSNVATLDDNVSIKLEPLSNQIIDDPESPVNLSSLGMKNFAANWLNSHAQAQQQQQILLQSQNSDDWQSSSPITSIPNHLQALTFPGALAQYLPLPGFSLTDAGQLQRPPVGPAPIRIFNPDAYCDLCNKEFCNKYFLKTHKANKHGIYVDGPCQNPGDNSMPGSMFSGSFNSTGNVKLEQTRLEVPSPLVSVPANNNSVPCEICQKRFKNDDSLRKHKQKIHHDSMDSQESHSLPATSNIIEEDREIFRNSPSAMEALFKQEFGVEQEDSKFMPAPRHLSPQSSQQARDSGFNVDRLRRLGVINPEAFCEICCKEYCNKYFLRTHKMKRHGVYIQESEKPPCNPGTAASWHQIQTSPLNLIVADSNPGSSSESCDRSIDDYECKPCGIRFQTSGLYRTHRTKFHEQMMEDQPEKSPKQDFDIDSIDRRTESISEDLQKLQTMILQLNGLESGKTLNCGICGRDCENIVALRNHMSLEHAAGVSEEIASPLQINESSNTLNGTSTFCTLCEKEYQSPAELRQHITDEHQNTSNNPSTTISPQIPIISPAIPVQTSVPMVTSAVTIPVPQTTGQMQTPTTPQQPERKITSMTPTSSYCELCRKELCNKYFMKTHMQKMHNIEIENGSQIGGVICNICNKELCSKYFLRVHKQNTHGIVDEGSTAASKQESYESLSNDDTALKPDQLGDLSHRYFTHFTEVCPVCSRRFRSIKWLKAHLLGDHGKVGIDKWRELENQYQNSSRSVVKSSGPTSRTIPQNSSIKIPNGLEMIQQSMKTVDYGGLGNQVLSNLFGSTNDEQQAKSYRCTYCNFTTTVLPFLFLHEKSHTSPQNNNPGVESGTLLCPICSQSFVQPELLHHHLLTRHQFSGLSSQLPGPLMINSTRQEAENNDRNNDIYEKADYEVKEERSRVSPQQQQQQQVGSLVNAESIKMNAKTEEQAVHVTPQGAYKCAQCGYATANLKRIKKHIRDDHKTLGDATESVIDELSKTLRDVANKQKLPASYAMPQDMNSNPDVTTVMQPFLLEERNIGRNDDETSNEKRFAPALVYLPVRARISNSLTASFTLSPA